MKKFQKWPVIDNWQQPIRSQSKHNRLGAYTSENLESRKNFTSWATTKKITVLNCLVFFFYSTRMTHFFIVAKSSLFGLQPVLSITVFWIWGKPLCQISTVRKWTKCIRKFDKSRHWRTKEGASFFTAMLTFWNISITSCVRRRCLTLHNTVLVNPQFLQFLFNNNWKERIDVQ